MGGSSGGSTGQVDYPEYMKLTHQSWLEAMDGHIINMQSSNPFITATAYNPDSVLNDNVSALATFNAVISAIDASDNWYSAFNSVSTKLGTTPIDIQEQVDSYTEILDNDIRTKVLPQFKRGMQNIGASMGSAFVIGEAIIWADRDRSLSKFQTDLVLKNADLDARNKEMISQNVQLIMQNILQEAELWRAFVHYSLESGRLKIIAKSEEAADNLEYDVKSARWYAGSYTEACNLIASISGAAVNQGITTGISKTATALGGAISGAAAGAMIGTANGGTGVGTAIGAVVGAAAGLLA